MFPGLSNLTFINKISFIFRKQHNIETIGPKELHLSLLSEFFKVVEEEKKIPFSVIGLLDC